MRSTIIGALLVFIVPLFTSCASTSNKSVVDTESKLRRLTIRPLEQIEVMGFPQHKIAYVPVKDLTMPPLTAKQKETLANFRATLPHVLDIQSFFSLFGYQTPVKNQNPRGSCDTFSFIGAIEAYYRRHYNLVLDLSEEYFIHIIHSTSPTHNPNLHHENSSSACGTCFKRCVLSTYLPPGDAIMASDAIAIPEEQFAPYFGNMHANSVQYPNHSEADRLVIVEQNGIVCDDCDPDNPPNTYTLTQKALDNYEYDPRYIPLEARKNARYGATKVQLLSPDETRDVTFLEQTLAAGYEVKVGVGLGKLDVGDGNVFRDGTAVAQHPDGHPIALWPKDGVNEWQDSNGKWVDDGHSMLLIGYDRARQLFLFKNSWGTYLPYFWVPYSFLQTKSSGGAIVLDVRDPQSGPSPEAMWIGKWIMDHDGWQGFLVLRRTRSRGGSNTMGIYSDTSSGTKARLGTYYDHDGVAHTVTGYVPYPMATQITLFIDFDNPEGPPDAENAPVVLRGQEFTLEMFISASDPATFGNYAAGITTWNNIKFGALIHRDSAPIQITHTPDTFTIDRWRDDFKLYFSGGAEASFKITDISPAPNALYYSLTDTYNGNSGHHAAIDKDHLNRLFFFGAYEPDLFYHTRERGIVSGLGVFGVPQGHIAHYSPKPNVVLVPAPSGQVIVTITCTGCEKKDTVIRYTMDGTVPTKKSPVYAGPLTLGGDVVINARVFRGDQAVSNSAVEAYRPAQVRRFAP